MIRRGRVPIPNRDSGVIRATDLASSPHVKTTARMCSFCTSAHCIRGNAVGMDENGGAHGHPQGCPTTGPSTQEDTGSFLTRAK